MAKRAKRQVSPSLSIQAMLDRLPRGCLGEFDFVSGLLYVDCRETEYEELSAKRKKLGSKWDSSLSPREKLLTETTLHEYFHYLQVLSSGYLIEIVLALLDALQMALNRLQHDGADEIRLAAFGRMAERILRPLSGRDSPSALSPLDLIEGGAYFFQSRSLGRAPDHAGMLKALALPGLGPVYRRAYERASRELGEDAFRWFLVCVGSALLFADPPAVFEDLLALRAAAGKKRGKQTSFGDMVQAVGERHLFIGSALDVRKLRKEKVFPWYEEPLSRLAKSDDTLPAFFQIADDRLLGRLRPPLVFRDSYRGELGIPAMFAVVASRSSLRFTLPYTGLAQGTSRKHS
jgi:hypothetical protein